MRGVVLLFAGIQMACGGVTRIDSVTVANLGNQNKVGVLVMAHGGGDEWNQEVAQAVNPMSEDVPVAVAYGMANPMTLQASLDSLDSEGVTHVAVVRMFLSGQSFLDQTKFFLGLSDEPLEMFVMMGPMALNPEMRKQLAHDQIVATHTEGMIDSDEAAVIMSERASELSSMPANEAVLIIAHGMGDEGENNELLAAMDRVVKRVELSGYADVQAVTLREDWEKERIIAERNIRAYVSEQSEEGHSVTVLPMRLSGFGPYAEVLSGLDYSPGIGLLPHSEISTWIRSMTQKIIDSEGWTASTSEFSGKIPGGQY
ncbi:MAG: hypothetical protein CME30_04670 [Gemmatimonadetes bacterium]|nr:hypothetical protein [Gemmatimonadota bacterium]